MTYPLSTTHRLTKTDTSSIRVFLQAYDQYIMEVKVRGERLPAKNVVCTKLSRSANIKFCVDVEWVESLTALAFFDDVLTYDILAEWCYQNFLDENSIASKKVATLDVLDDLVEKKLRIYLVGSISQSWIENLFVL